MLTRNSLIGFGICLIVTCYPSKYRLFNNRDLVLIWARNTRLVRNRFNAKSSILHVLPLAVLGKVVHVEFPEIQRTRPVASLLSNRLIAKRININILIIRHNAFLVDQTQQKIHPIEMLLIKNILFLHVILTNNLKNYLSHHYLFSPKKSSIMQIEIHLLLISLWFLADP